MNAPPKNMISVIKKIHVPRTAASNCCSLSAKWCWTWDAVACELLDTLGLRPRNDGVVICLFGDDRRLLEVVRGRRRRHRPLESGRAPRVRAGTGSLALRPHQVEQR